MANDNPWVVRESKQHADLPEASYMVIFRGVEDYVMYKGTDKEALKWRFLWEVKTGQLAGTKSDTLTDRDITPDTQSGKLIAGLLGKAIKAGDNPKELVDACVGKTYMGVCQKGKQNGKACIRVITLPPEM